MLVHKTASTVIAGVTMVTPCGVPSHAKSSLVGCPNMPLPPLEANPWHPFDRVPMLVEPLQKFGVSAATPASTRVLMMLPSNKSYLWAVWRLRWVAVTPGVGYVGWITAHVGGT